MTSLGVNIDHVATLRQARRAGYPSLLEAARACIAGGADQITVHLREDRRHIQDEDVHLLRRELAVPLNMELAAVDEIIRIACALHPHEACLVPERRQELTTEGGLDVLGGRAVLRPAIARLRDAGIRVSLFIEPSVDAVRIARDLGADAVELHTGAYSRAPVGSANHAEHLQRLRDAAALAVRLGLVCNAGHGLDYENVGAVARLPGIATLNIGFSIIAHALFVGLTSAVRRMRDAMQ
jgi:pyridoxine 5-phosphate synthase